MNEIIEAESHEKFVIPTIGWGKFQDYFESVYNKLVGKVIEESPCQVDNACQIAAELTINHIESLGIEIVRLKSVDRAHAQDVDLAYLNIHMYYTIDEIETLIGRKTSFGERNYLERKLPNAFDDIVKDGLRKLILGLLE